MEAVMALNAFVFLILILMQTRRNTFENLFAALWVALFLINLFFVLKMSGYIVKVH